MEKQATSPAPLDPNVAMLMEWFSEEGVTPDEYEILNRLAHAGVTAVSNALWHEGWKTGVEVLLTILYAGFQVGRNVGRGEIKDRKKKKPAPMNGTFFNKIRLN